MIADQNPDNLLSGQIRIGYAAYVLCV